MSERLRLETMEAIDILVELATRDDCQILQEVVDELRPDSNSVGYSLYNNYENY